MSEMLPVASPWARAALGVGLDVALRSSIVIVLALVLHGLLGRRRVLVRSVLWNACLLGLLALPAATAAIPRLRLAWLPMPDPARAAGPLEVPTRSADAARSAADPLPAPAPLPPPVAPGAAVDPPIAADARRSWRDVGDAIVVAYAIVAAALLVRLALSLHAVGKLRRASRPVPEGTWTCALSLWSGRLGIRRAVALTSSGRLGGPVVVGWLRPTIVLPEALARAAAPEVIDAVILHELAHVRRGDYAWNLLHRVVQALYWPQPLAWPIGLVVASVREQACDELCVFSTGDSRRYRATLLEIAESLVHRPREALGLAMARPTRLGRRLAHLATTTGASRCLLHAPARGLIVALVIGAVCLLGSIRLARTAAAGQPQAEPAAPREPAAQKAPQPQETPGSDPADPQPEATPPKNKEAPPPEGNLERPAEPKDRVVEVVVGKARREPWARILSTNGQLQVLPPWPVHARIAGIVDAKGLASVGDRVRKGDVLAQLEPTTLPSELAGARAVLRRATSRQKQAQAALVVSKATVEAARARVDETKLALQQSRDNFTAQARQSQRIGELFQKMAASREEADAAVEKLRAAETDKAAAESRLRSAEAALEQATAEKAAAEVGIDAVAADVDEAQADVDRVQGLFTHTKVVAPIDGIVHKRNVEPGSPASPEQETPLFMVARTDALSLTILAAEADAALIRPGLEVMLRPTVAGGRWTGGTVRRLGAEIENGRFRIDVDVPNAEGRLRPGEQMIATVVLEPPHEAVTVPVDALRIDPRQRIALARGEVSCFQVKDGRAVVTRLKVGLGNGRRIEVLAGLKGDETLILDLAGGGRGMNMTEGTLNAVLSGETRVKAVDAPASSRPRRPFYGRAIDTGSVAGSPEELRRMIQPPSELPPRF